MPLPTVSRLAARVAGKTSLRTVLIVPFVLQIVGTVGLVGYLSFRSGQKSVENLAHQLMVQVGKRVSDRLTTYLQAPHDVVAANHLAVEQGILDINNFEQLRQQFWQQIALNPSIEALYFSNESEGEIGYGRLQGGHLQGEEALKKVEQVTGEDLSIGTPYFSVLRSTDPGKRKYYLVDSRGNPRKLIYTFKIDSRTTPWYRTAKASKQQTWSPISVYKVIPLLGIFAVTPIYNEGGKWQGAFVSSFTLSGISTFLDQLDFSPSGQIFIMERSGKLVATSTQEPLLVKQAKGEPGQLLAVNSKDARTRDIARQLTGKFGNFHTLQTTQQLNLVSNCKRQFVQVTPYRDKYGLDWLVVVVVPESDFMEQINTNTRITILLCIAALIGSTGIGIFTARWITQPIVRLNTAAKDIARGQWDKPVELERTDEVGQLANSFNTMTVQRQHAEELLAHYNRTLEAQVAERTAEFVKANDQLRLEIAERELIEGKLSSSTHQVRTIFESISDIVLIIDAQKSIQVIPTKTLGSYTCDTNLLNRIVEQFFQEDTEKNWFAKVQQVLETQQNINFDYSLTINNQEIWFTACISPLPDNSVVWVARDISDRKRTELELHSAQQRLEYLLTSIPAVIFSCPPRGDYTATFMSENVSAILGYNAQEFLNNSQFWAMRVHPNDMEGILAQLPQLFEQEFCAYEYRFLHADGTYHWLYTQLRLVKDEMGNPLECVGYLIDIHDKKLADNQRQESEKRYRELFEKSVDGIVSTDMEGRFLNCNASYQKMLGYSLEELKQATYQEITPSQWYSMEVEIVEKQIIGRGYSDTYEKEYIRKDGTVFPVEINAYCQKNEAGQPEMMWAIVRDISERKLAEQALQASQARFAGILEIANDAIITVDAKQRITLFNQGAEKIFGYKADEVLGQPLDLLLPTCLREIHHQHITNFSNSVGKARPMGERSEIFGCRKDGTQFPAEASISKLEMNGEKVFTTILRDISDRKLAEERLRQSESQLNTIITTTSDGIMILDREGKVRFANPAATALLNRSVDEFVDYPWGIPLGEIAEIEVVVSRDEIRTVEMKATQTQWLGESAYVLALRDISDRKRAEAALRESEEQLQLALEGSGDGFWDWNIPTGEVYLSPRYLEMLGYEADELPQEFSTWEQLIHPDDQPWVIDTLNAHLADSSVPYNFDYRILTKSGEWKWIANYGKVVARDLDGTPLRMAGTHRDVSGKKLAEIKLQQAVLSAEAANRAKSTFLANMSHELRTPLNGILGYAQILQGDKNFTPKQQDGINIIYQCGTHLLTLINDILDLSKIEAEKLELSPEDVHLPTFLTELSDIFQLKAVQKDIKFTYLPCSQLPAVIQADEKRLRQVLMNLLSNAVKFTDRGHVTFKVTLIDNQQHDQSFTAKIRFQVEDTGIGIMPEQLENIFLPFEQVGDKSRRSEGTGLGLAITQKILQMMGSQIFVESTPQVGSRFWFDVDFSLVSTPTNSTPVKSTASIVGYSGAQQKILVVDDRWENCAVIINMLEPIGFELAEAANGQEGLKKAIEFQPDLILVDLIMPVMDGYQMTRQLRQLPEFQTTIIIAVSANAFELDRQQSLDSGCNDFLSKPVQAQDLLDKIQDYLTLSWIYDNTKEFQSLGLESSDKPLSSSTEMVFPPRHELLALHQAVLMGDVEAVEYELIRLQDVGVEYMSFVIRALELAQDFDYEGIAKLIEPHLS